jgi:hypothetical protein
MLILDPFLGGSAWRPGKNTATITKNAIAAALVRKQARKFAGLSDTASNTTTHLDGKVKK